MARFVIFEQADAIGDDAAFKARFVRDGFSFLGFLIPPLWLLWHRLFIEAALAFAALFAIGVLGETMQGMGFAASLLSLLLSLYVGLEGANLRIAALGRRGWREWGTVNADTLADAEIRYATAVAVGHTPEVSTPPPPSTPTAMGRPDAGPALGLLAYPGGCLMRVAIIDYGSGNLRSATKAFERAARESGVAAEILLTADADTVRAADRIVLPGVGAYADCAAGLRAVDGMWEAVEETAVARARPFLGICVGMQLMSERGLEKTVSRGFGWIAGDVKEIEPDDPTLKIPQIGWNTIHVKHPHPLFDGIRTGDEGLHAYFVHSYHLASRHDDEVLAVADYGGPVTAAVARNNLAGTQFHPEKSQALGLALIANFLRWKP